ncbi:MAG: PEP/pyruvate-binding domain-containing protein [Proteobacteria bacterium]|nr:PEP/pyruvate-binding domain-containing protein [Pseudomonadota bacterium]
MAEKWLYWFEELGSEHNDLVGKKCANLGEMTGLGMRVPPGFAVGVAGWKLFMAQTGAGEEIRRYVKEKFKDHRDVGQQVAAGRVIRGIVESGSMPAPMRSDLEAHYQELCRRSGVDDVPVAVRSSGAVSMPGQMETFLNVIGTEDVVEHVIRVWSSAFTTRAIAWRVETGLDPAEAPIGVAVLKMVRPKSAGVVLTVLPTIGDTSKTIVEGNWGLGESVVSGEITPDSFVVDKQTGEVDQTISPKTQMVVHQKRGIAVVEVPAEIREVPCLTGDELREIVRVAHQVEDHFGVPQDMEWVVDDDLTCPENIFWVQARPAKYTAKKENDSEYLAELMTRLFQT